MRTWVNRRWRIMVALSVLLTMLLSSLAGEFSLTEKQVAAQSVGNTFYVSKSGNNADGKSWATAWSELAHINWSVVQAGDTILLDGGASAMTYTTSLVLGKSGASGKPITIRLAREQGRNGKAVIFGGRSTPLPYGGQKEYAYDTSARAVGISFNGQDWVVIDGTKWRGIDIHGFNKYGIQCSSSSNDVTVRNVEIYDNGTAYQSGDGWHTDQKGVSLSGTNITFERVIIHDNGQDAFQSGGGVRNFTLRDSWLYNGRTKPDGSVWNYDRHPDGIQIWGGGEQSGVTVENSVIGPGFMQGMLLGDAQATIHDVTVRNSLFYGSGNSNIMSHPNQPVASRNWLIERVTSDRPVGDNWTNIGFSWSGGLGSGSQLTVRDSIFTGGYDLYVPSNGAYSGNYQFKAGSHKVGTEVDPRYANGSAYGNRGVDADFTLAADSPAKGKGSGITSAAKLLAQASAPPPPPAPTATPTPGATQTPVASPTATPPPAQTPLPTPTATAEPPRALAWEAESGSIASPFVVSGGSIFQPAYTARVADGGRAAYKFNLPVAGDYVVKMVVSAADAASNSFWVNVDAEPTDPLMIWDIPPASGFVARTVSWRANGTPEANGLSPKVFSLAAGQHELIIRGREGKTYLDRITLAPAP